MENFSKGKTFSSFGKIECHIKIVKNFFIKVFIKKEQTKLTSSPAGGSGQHRSGGRAREYSRAQGPTNKEAKIDPQSGSATRAPRS